MTKLIPMPGYLILDLQALDATTESGIVLPESEKLKPNEGVVIAIGKPKPITVGDDTGKVEIRKLEIGDRVIYREYSGQAYKEGDSNLLICKDDDLLAVIGK